MRFSGCQIQRPTFINNYYIQCKNYGVLRKQQICLITEDWVNTEALKAKRSASAHGRLENSWNGKTCMPQWIAFLPCNSNSPPPNVILTGDFKTRSFIHVSCSCIKMFLTWWKSWTCELNFFYLVALRCGGGLVKPWKWKVLACEVIINKRIFLQLDGNLSFME